MQYSQTSSDSFEHFLLENPSEDFYSEGIQHVFQTWKTSDCKAFTSPCLEEKKKLKSVCSTFETDISAIEMECASVDSYQEEYKNILQQYKTLSEQPFDSQYIKFLKTHSSSPFYSEGTDRLLPLFETISDTRSINSRTPNERDTLDEKGCPFAIQSFLTEQSKNDVLERNGDIQTYVDIKDNYEKIGAVQQTLSLIKNRAPEEYASFQSNMMTVLQEQITNASENKFSYYSADDVPGPVQCYRTLKTLGIPFPSDIETAYTQAINGYLKEKMKESCPYSINEMYGKVADNFQDIFADIYFYKQDLSSTQFRSYKKKCVNTLNKSMKNMAYGRYKDGHALKEVARRSFIRYVMGDTWANKYYKRGKQLDK